jgi:hypothetical protein
MMMNIVIATPFHVLWAGPVVHTEENRNSYNVAVGKPDRKRPLGISRLR